MRLNSFNMYYIPVHTAKTLVLLLFMICSNAAFCQAETDSTAAEDDSDTTEVAETKMQKPEIFTSGFIDIFNSGQVNASARFLRRVEEAW